MGAPVVELCPRDSWREALELLHARLPAFERRLSVEHALRNAQNRELDLSRLWIARRRGRVSSVLLAQLLGGRIGAVWPPVWRADSHRDDPVALVNAAIAAFVVDDALLIQALIDREDAQEASGVLSRGGLPYVTDLHFMALKLREHATLPATESPLAWRSFRPEGDAGFRSALSRTYEATLDMPELHGARAIDEILAGYRAAGEFDPALWQLGRLRDEPNEVAVLLLRQMPERDAVELTYLGLVPDARGRGLGQCALAHALTLAQSTGRSLVELAVDSRNTPALRLYRSTGFVETEVRRAHLLVVNQTH